MEITFELTEEDYINYNISHAGRSPSMKKSIFIQRIMGPAIFVFMPFIVMRFTDIPLWYWLLVFGGRVLFGSPIIRNMLAGKSHEE